MPFTLATFNVYWLFDKKEPLQRWGIQLPPGGLTEKIEITAQAIASIGENGPDIIGLQEVENAEVVAALCDKLKTMGHDFKYQYCSDTLDPFTGQNVATISKFPAAIRPVTRLDQHVRYYKDYRERERAGSLGKFLRVDIEVDGNVISVFNIHLKSKRGGAEITRHLRNAQAEIVRDMSRPRIEQGSSRSPSFTVVLGDFNDEPSTTPLDILQGKRDTSYTLETATLNAPEEERWTNIYNDSKQQLDHILLSRFAYERMNDAGFTRIEDEVSDHDAVWAVLDLTSDPGP